MKIINSEVGIFSDPHYGIHRNNSTWHNIALEHAEWAAKEFKQRGIKDIIIPGDIFHDRNDIAVNTLHMSTHIFDILKDFNIIITTGNHDAFYKDKSDINSVSIFRGWENITVIDTLATKEFFGRKISFCPWGQDINEVPKCDIIFGHFEINTFKMNAFKVCTHGLKVTDLTSRAPLTISGHFHQREERKYQNGTILYVGNPYQQDWGDYGTTKGLYVLDIEKMGYEFIENTVSPVYKKVMYSDIDSGKYTAAELKTDLKKNIIKFYVDKPLDVKEVDNVVRKLVAQKPTEFTIEYDFTAANKIDTTKANDTNFNISIENSIDEFIELLDIENKTEVKSYLTELYQKAQSK